MRAFTFPNKSFRKSLATEFDSEAFSLPEIIAAIKATAETASIAAHDEITAFKSDRFTPSSTTVLISEGIASEHSVDTRHNAATVIIYIFRNIGTNIRTS